MFGALSATDLIIVLVSIVISLSVHEAMHAYAAHKLGDMTAHDEGRLTLNPLKHVDFLTTVLLPFVLILFGFPPFFIAKPVPFNPDNLKYGEYGMALVGVAGPLTNLALAVIGVLLMHITGAAMGTDLFQALIIFVQINIGFFVFNMIPFPPLDGSRLLYAFAPDGLRRIMIQIESMGFMTIILFMIVLYPFLLRPIVTSVSNGLLDFLLRF